MISILLVISIAILIWGFIYGNENYHEDAIGQYTIGGFLFTISLVALIIGVVKVSSVYANEQKIIFYEQHNQQVELEIKTAVEQYIVYETGVFEDISGQDLTVLLARYPEIKADELVKMQVETIINNNTKILTIKDKLADVLTWKFVLWFGK